jgi:butyrate kinase
MVCVHAKARLEWKLVRLSGTISYIFNKEATKMSTKIETSEEVKARAKDSLRRMFSIPDGYSSGIIEGIVDDIILAAVLEIKKKLKPKSKKIKDFQQRVIDEKRELDEKLARLNAFVISQHSLDTVGEMEQYRLKKQRKIMEDYSDILSKRISAMELEND